MNSKLSLVPLVAAALCAGCLHRAEVAQPTMQSDLSNLEANLAFLPAAPRPAIASGSVWTTAGPGAALVRDTSAFRLNDQVTVVLRERVVGSNSSGTALDRQSDVNFGVDVAFGLEDPNPTPGEPSLNTVLKGKSSSSFDGEGETSRANSLTGDITARVVRVMPNGDLVVAGQKTVMINREQQVLTLVGTVRPVDIDRSNKVPSGEIGDLTVRLWGQGEVDATAQQGWFIRIMNRIWPF